MLDDYWRLATGIELYADIEAFTDAGIDAGAGRHLGMVLARPHATGWFFSAHHRPGMNPQELTDLAEFAKVRAYLLLTRGPTPTTWVPGPRHGEWIAWLFADRTNVAASVPDDPA